MESMIKVSRSFGGGFCRAAGAVAWGARRFLSAIPLLGIAPPNYSEENEELPDKDEDITGGEEAESASSPAEENKSSVSSPTEKEGIVEGVTEPAVGTEAKPEDEKPSVAVSVPVAVSTSPSTEDKKEESSTPAPTPVPVEASNKLDEMDKQVAEPLNAVNIVEVSPVKEIIEVPVEVNSQSKQKATTTSTTTTTTTSTTSTTTTTTTAPSIIERKTSEDIQSQCPSSPPPTPIDPSPLQQAQQVAANASALAEALKLPAEQAANDIEILNASSLVEKSTVITAQSTILTNYSSSRSDDITESSENHKILPITEQISEITTSESHEQTGKNDLTIPANNVTDTNDKTEEPAVQEPLDEIPIPNIVETIDSVEPHENDLVIQTEEGPIPVSCEIIETKPIIEVETPAEEIKIIQVIPKLVENPEDVAPEDNLKNIETVEISGITTTEFLNLHGNIDQPEKEIPPPLPVSPVPVPKATSQLLNFMSTQIEEVSSVIDDTIENATCLLPELVAKDEEEKKGEDEGTIEIEEIVDETQSQTDDTSFSLPPPEETSESRIEQILDTSQELPPAPLESHEEESIDPNNTRDMENTIDSEISEVANSPTASIPQIPTDTIILTPPRSPSPNNSDDDRIDIADKVTLDKSSSQFELVEDTSNNAFKTESVEDSLNSYNNSEIELKERLAETPLEDNDATTTTTTTTAIVNGLISHDIEDNDQSKIETPVENNIVANENGTTEANDDAPQSPPPAVPAEIPAQNLGPAITEDVASVTKAIEEIDINEKAVAAAVNENIESANTNEIIADMNHHNNMKE